MMNLQPILAADLIQTIFGIIVFIIWIVGQFLGSREQAKRKQRPVRQPKPGPAAPAPPEGAPVRPANQGPRDQAEALRSEVEEFLRRAQGKPTEAKKPSPQQTKPPRTERPKRQPTLRETRPPRKPTQQQPQVGQPGGLRTEGVAEHVERHLSPEEITVHSSSLGTTVATADDRVEARLHEKFDHSLGKLERRETVVEKAEEPNEMATELAQMLSKPEGMRQLIIANEILRRPDW